MLTIYILLVLCSLILIFYFLYFKQENYYNTRKDCANDVSELNLTTITKTIYIHNIDDINNAIMEAKNKNITIGMYGSKHSMGGHTIPNEGIRLDMNHFNKIISLDVDRMTVTVQSGLLWYNLIKYLNQFGLSPMTLQSYSSFSIGGSISVNSHGITNDNTLVDSIEQIKIINYDCKELICDRKNNSELFSLIIGGYGLFGVITEIKLKVVPNSILSVKKYMLNINNFEEKYKLINNNPKLNIKLARIDITNMENIYLYCFNDKFDNTITNRKISKLSPEPNKMSKITQFMYKWLMPSRLFQKLRFNIEKSSNKPIDIPNSFVDRNQLLYESAEPLAKMYSPIVDLNMTHILQEFFIPQKYFKKWMYFLQKYILNRLFLNVSLLNITIRFVKMDTTTFLRYAKEDMYAFVFYYRITKNDDGDNEIKNIHLDLTDEVIRLNGTFYLPYRHHYDKYQLIKCYPEIKMFLDHKIKYDPNEIFTNLWYDKIKKLIN